MSPFNPQEMVSTFTRTIWDLFVCWHLENKKKSTEMKYNPVFAVFRVDWEKFEAFFFFCCVSKKQLTSLHCFWVCVCVRVCVGPTAFPFVFLMCHSAMMQTPCVFLTEDDFLAFRELHSQQPLPKRWWNDGFL